jgi:protein-S-isoprenylcysteine O-methyltransferase Ste14
LLDVCLDWGERLFVLGLYGFLVSNVVGAFLHYGGGINLLLLVSEGLIILFFLIRRPARAISRNWFDWLLALIVTCSGLLVLPAQWEIPALVGYVGLFCYLIGLGIVIYGTIFLGRSFGMVPAHRGVQVAGPYRLVRHPIYAGYQFSHLAFLLMNPTWWNLGLYGLGTALQLLRLLAEERLLSQDPAYRAYQAAVPDRLLPGDRWVWNGLERWWGGRRNKMTVS